MAATVHPTVPDGVGPLLTTTQAGRRLRIPPQQVYERIDAGDPPAYRLKHGVIGVPEAAVEAIER